MLLLCKVWEAKEKGLSASFGKCSLRIDVGICEVI